MSENGYLKGPIFLAILAGAVFLSTINSSVCRANALESAAPEVYQGQTPLPLDVFSEGKTKLKAGENLQDGRARAVIDAERDALLGALKQVVHPMVFSYEKDNVVRVLMAKKGSLFPEPGLIVEEGAEADTYIVRMSARISRDRLENVLMKYVAARRIILSVSDNPDGKPSKGHVLGSSLATAARGRGYRVIYPGDFADEKTKTLAAAYRSGDREAGKALGLYLLAATVIEGRVSAAHSEVTREIYSSRAEGSLRVTKIGGERTSFSVSDVKGFGSNEQKAGTDAMRKASVILSSKSVKSLSGRQKKI
jgi:hypothetical protein